MMNTQTQTLTTQLNTFVTTSFEEHDHEILLKLAEVYVNNLPSHDGGLVTSEELNLVLLMKVLRIDKSNRTRTAKTIMKYVNPESVSFYMAGNYRAPTALTFASFDGFIAACICLRNERAKIVQHFAAKCTALFVQLFVEQTRLNAELLAAKDQIITSKEEDIDQLKERHAWTRILRLRGIASGSFTRHSERARKMFALINRLKNAGNIEWISKKPYFKSEKHYMRSRDTIRGWQL